MRIKMDIMQEVSLRDKLAQMDAVLAIFKADYYEPEEYISVWQAQGITVTWSNLFSEILEILDDEPPTKHEEKSSGKNISV